MTGTKPPCGIMWLFDMLICFFTCLMFLDVFGCSTMDDNGCLMWLKDQENEILDEVPESARSICGARGLKLSPDTNSD